MIEKLKLSIRKASKTDLKEVSEIFIEESSKKPYLQEWTKETSLEKIRELFKKGDISIATSNIGVLGFIACHRRCQGKDVFIDEFWVKSNYQKMGVGKALLNFIEGKCRNGEIESIALISDKKSGAFIFYKKLGYKEANQYVLMKKKLSNYA